MREIKFRGWCEKDSEWRYGFYITDDKVHEINTMLKSGEFYASQVDSDSVGQYTGRKDKNGVEIYEGDICRITLKEGTDGEFYCTMKVVFEEYAFKFKDEDGLWSVSETPIEVIGNIYENPELLQC